MNDKYPPDLIYIVFKKDFSQIIHTTDNKNEAYEISDYKDGKVITYIKD